jgi:hypothetical protein
MTNQPSNQPKKEQPPFGFYLLMGTVGACLAVVILYLIASYFAK